MQSNNINVLYYHPIIIPVRCIQGYWLHNNSVSRRWPKSPQIRHLAAHESTANLFIVNNKLRYNFGLLMWPQRLRYTRYKLINSWRIRINIESYECSYKFIIASRGLTVNLMCTVWHLWNYMFITSLDLLIDLWNTNLVMLIIHKMRWNFTEWSSQFLIWHIAYNFLKILYRFDSWVRGVFIKFKNYFFNK